MIKILILINSIGGLYRFRKELVDKLLKLNYVVYISAPEGEESTEFVRMGAHCIDVAIDRRGTNVFHDLKLFFTYIKVINKIQPDLILTYTIKPNLYGGLAAGILNISHIHTVTGLGSVFIRRLWFKWLIVKINRYAFKKSSCIYFLNHDNMELYKNLKIISDQHRIRVVHGSGVNLKNFKFMPLNENEISFVFIGRLLKDKGIEEYLESAKNIKIKNPMVNFHVVGNVEEEKYKGIIKKMVNSRYVKYHGFLPDVRSIISEATCVVLPSYGEGCGTVLQEAAGIGRPLITCKTYGCRDNVEDGKNGYLCEVRNASSLEEKMQKFIQLSFEEKRKMGICSRKLAEKNFDRDFIIRDYISTINTLLQ